MENLNDFIFFEKRNDYLFKGKISNYILEQLYIYDLSNKSLVGNIYRGRIVNKISGINGFFVDIGENKNAFFQIESEVFNMFKSGEEDLFQVISDENGTKGPKVTNKYEIKGNYLILTPFKKGLNVSRKIQDTIEKERILDIIKTKIPNNLGGVVRTDAQFKDKETLSEEINRILEIYQELEKERNFSPTPKLIYENNNLFEIKNRDKKVIITNDSEIFETLSKKYSHLEIKYLENFKIIDNYEIYTQIKDLFKRNVKLENGIELVFDKTEAFNVIDVNSAGYINKKSAYNILDHVNFKCIDDILRHIELRNLCGIILVDLISFSDKDQEFEFIENLKKTLDLYYSNINFHGITNLGILELTRNRRVNNLGLNELTLDIFR